MSKAAAGDEGGALTERERRELESIEHGLAEEDPELAHTLRTATGAAGVVVGVCTLVVIILGGVFVLGALAGDAVLVLVTMAGGGVALLIRRRYQRMVREVSRP